MREHYLLDVEVHRSANGYGLFGLWKTILGIAPSKKEVFDSRPYGQRMDDEEDQFLQRQRKLARLARFCTLLIVAAVGIAWAATK